MPIINLPVERIERQKNAKDQGYADDRHIDRRLAEAVATIAFKTAPFFIVPSRRRWYQPTPPHPGVLVCPHFAGFHLLKLLPDGACSANNAHQFGPPSNAKRA
jgi:hypothetical protein